MENMLNNKRFEVNGFVTALQPIVHNEIGSLHGSKQAGEPTKQRTMPFVVSRKENDVTFREIASVPVISGNSLRGIARRLLLEFSLDAMNIKLGDIIEKDKNLKDIAYLFSSGGLTPKSSKIGATRPGVYDEIHGIPWLGLFGGVYYGNQFDGSAKFGNLVPCLKETYPLYENVLPIDDADNLPDLLSLTSKIESSPVRFTRRASAKNQVEDGAILEEVSVETAEIAENAAEEDSANSGKSETKRKEAMIYGTEVIPGGVRFFSTNSCISEEEGVQLAFYASLALLSNHAYIGGMTGRGMGAVVFDYPIDIEESLTKYHDYLKKNKEDIVRRIAMIPESFKATSESEKTDKEAAKEAKKGKGASKK